jgi:hypothetical protein
MDNTRTLRRKRWSLSFKCHGDQSRRSSAHAELRSLHLAILVLGQFLPMFPAWSLT